jgi:hypothetical protein
MAGEMLLAFCIFMMVGWVIWEIWPDGREVGSGVTIVRGSNQNLTARTEEEKNALRLARTILSDLYAYHGEAIRRGRAGRCLYPILGEVLERALTLYGERIPEGLRKRTGYLETLLIYDLAQGRIEAFGNPNFIRRLTEKAVAAA